MEELEQKDPNILSKLKEEAKRMSKDGGILIHSVDLIRNQEGQKIPLNYGFVFLQALCNELHISEIIAEFQAKTSIQYPLNEILELLVCSRALNPSS